jgi:hypothetical protein
MIEIPSKLAANHEEGVMQYEPQFRLVHTFVLHNGAVWFVGLYTFDVSYVNMAVVILMINSTALTKQVPSALGALGFRRTITGHSEFGFP